MRLPHWMKYTRRDDLENLFKSVPANELVCVRILRQLLPVKQSTERDLAKWYQTKEIFLSLEKNVKFTNF